MSTHLFVYGSLRRDSAHPLALRLAAASRPLGPARTRGQLIDLGEYPGLVRGEGQVVGEVLELDETPASAQLWEQLDAYEDVSPPPPQAPLYERVQIDCQLAGRELRAWAYLYLGPVEGQPRVESGDWLEYLLSR